MIVTEKSLTVRKKHSNSQCQIEVFRFCEEEKLVRLQLLNKRRFYKVFAQALIRPLCIFRLRGISLRKNSPNIRLLDKGCIWRDFVVSEVGESQQQRENYFRGKNQSSLTY